MRDQTARRTQFIPAHDSHLAVGLLLVFVHDLEGLVWFTAIILGRIRCGGCWRAGRCSGGSTAPRGGTLIGFGLKLGLSAR